jgi:hypothetical protein
MDSIPQILSGKFGIDARIESRNSFIDYQLVSITGLRAGLSFQRKLRFGVGLSWLDSDVISAVPAVQLPGDTALRKRLIKLAYFCVYSDVVFHKTKRWQLSVPLQVGLGSSWLEDPSSDDPSKDQPSQLLLLYEPGISAQYKFFRWFGAGADIAYRFTVRNSAVADRLSSPTYSFKVLVWFDQLFFVMFPKSFVTKRFGPAVW